ncbi:MAG: LysM peptidoglycan-binding domain-containing protein [Flavobacteriales bacterium]|nr:LysM peptidoglycan-binding domain-containing protein [Flavobacteriales bacterium]
MATVVFINPASYTHEHKVNYNEDVPIGAPGTPLMFKGISPETISFDIYFDATGAIDAPKLMPVNKLPIGAQITLFKKVCFTYNGDIHEPNYLILNWGSLVFKCKLSSLRVEYTLFQKNGIPLRAKASCTFIKAIDADTLAKEANNKSPDLTHLIEVKQGDTLPLICNRVYGDPSYYIEVAKYNNIVNFRNLVPGTKLYLPPIK